MFTEAEKRVFKYHDGQAEAFADPLAVRRSLTLATAGRFNDLLRRYYADTTPAVEGETEEHKQAREDANAAVELALCGAAAELVPAVRQAFVMPPFNSADGTGATEDDVDRVLTEFLDWCDEQKKSTVTTPISALPATSTPAA